MTKLKAGIIGATGYGGGELVKILLSHPDILLKYVTAGKHEGKLLTEALPFCRGFSDLTLAGHPSPGMLDPILDTLDILFLAMPHGQSQKLVPHLPKKLKIVDLAGDYRIKDREVFAESYGYEHESPKLLKDFVYGLTEVNRGKICEASRVANPGCFATAIQLALFPFIKHDLLSGPVYVDAKTGSSGSGIVPTQGTHHPDRDGNLLAYKTFTHQHHSEIMQTFSSLGWSGDLTMQVHSVPIVRGIFVTAYAQLKDEIPFEDIVSKTWDDSFFVRSMAGSPQINWVKHTNFADVSYAVKNKTLIAFSAIDNLLKGAAGQAVQNMNVMFGLDESSGLKLMGGHPS